MSTFNSTKLIKLGSCAFRQFTAESHCKYVHGYRLSAKITISCKEVDKNNWCFDFGDFKEIKSILGYQFDHTLCIAENDPLRSTFELLQSQGGCDLRIMPAVGIEKFAEWCYNTVNKFVQNRTHKRCWVSTVELFEHEENSAIYSPKCDNVAPTLTAVSGDELLAKYTEKFLFDEVPVPVVNGSWENVNIYTNPEPEPTPASTPDPVPTPTPEPNQRRGANVGSNNSPGKGNWFAGTTWGE